MATFWIYDYACSLHLEWTFLLRSRWSKVKGLYIIARYVPFLLLAGHLYTNFLPSENSHKCQLLNKICSFFSVISVFCSECFFALRTYALWNNKTVLVTIIATFIAAIASFIGFGIADSAIDSFSVIVPGITGCYQSSAAFQLFIPFIFLIGLEFCLMSLTLIRAIQSWRSTNSRMYAVLVKHNIFYYACGLFFSAVNALMLMLFPYPQNGYQAMFKDFQFIVLAILATRMHLHLWHTDQLAHGSSALVFIPLSDISSAGSPT